ncbi:uncharacterized protein LOC144437386 [Glandiceps talaboti]
MACNVQFCICIISSGVGVNWCIDKKKLGEEMPKHQPVYIFYIIASLWMYGLTVFFSQLSVSLGQEWGLFLNKTQDISDAYHTDFTPAYWTFQIWPVIYVWLGVAFGYLLTTTCRRNAHDYVYVKPKMHTWLFFITFIFNQGLQIGWSFLFDRQYMNIAIVFVALIAFTAYICLYDSMKNSVDHIREIKKCDLWATRILVHNSFAIYATWTTIATLLNLCLVLHYNADVDMDTATLVSLIIVSVEIVVWVVLETFVLDKYVRYTVTIYPTAIVAFAGIIDENWDPNKTTSIYTLVLLTISCCLCVARCMLVVYRHMKVPISVYPDGEGQMTAEEKKAYVDELKAQAMEMQAATNNAYKVEP